MSCIVSFLRGCICIWKKCYDKKWYLVIALLVIGLIILILQLVIMFYLSLTQEAPDGFEEVKPEGTCFLLIVHRFRYCHRQTILLKKKKKKERIN